MIAQDPVGPGSLWESRFVALDRLANCACLPRRQAHELEIEGQVDLVELLTIVRHQTLNRQIQFADEHALAVALGQYPHLLHNAMHARLVYDVVFSQAGIGGITWLPQRIRRIITELLIFEKHLERVYAEAIDTPLQPEMQDFIHRLTDFGVAPVEIRLFHVVHVQVVLPGEFIELPGWPAKPAHPSIGGTTIGSRISPDVPVSFLVNPARPRLLEPG